MIERYLTFVTHPLFLIALAMLAVFLVLQNMPKPGEVRLSPGVWLRKNYWKGMLALGLALGAGAGIFYLAEIAYSVSSMVDVLRETATGENPDAEDLRNLATGVAVLLGALAAAATLIFQLVRVWISERTTSATEEGLITDRINKAVEGLGAEKTVQRHRKSSDNVEQYSDDQQRVPIFDTFTEPNLEVRIGAIYALERIAQDSPRDHIQIMEILCAYIRENSNFSRPKSFHLGDWDPLDEGASKDAREAHAQDWEDRKSALRLWILDLPKPRTDIQVALEVIGRRSPAQIALERSADVRGSKVGFQLDLRSANLQACDIAELNFDHARLNEARLQGANLRRARLEGADLGLARLKGAILGEARLEGAYLREARLEGANLGEARLDASTDLRLATLRGAGLRSVDLSEATTNYAFHEAFGDGSVKLPDELKAGEPPLAHWATEDLEWDEFHTRWRAWQAEIGYTPPER